MAGGVMWRALGRDWNAAVKAAKLVNSTGCTPNEAIQQVIAELREGPPPVEAMQEPAEDHPPRPAPDSASAEALTRYLIAVARIAGCRDVDTLSLPELIDIAEVSPMRTVPLAEWRARREATS